MTHLYTTTYATLEVSPETFNEISRKLAAAGYPVDFPLSMDGIALTTQSEPEMVKSDYNAFVERVLR